MNILLCSIGSYTTASEIYTYKPGSIPKELNNDSKTIFSKIKSLNSKPN